MASGGWVIWVMDARGNQRQFVVADWWFRERSLVVCLVDGLVLAVHEVVSFLCFPMKGGDK